MLALAAATRLLAHEMMAQYRSPALQQHKEGSSGLQDVCSPVLILKSSFNSGILLNRSRKHRKMKKKKSFCPVFTDL